MSNIVEAGRKKFFCLSFLTFFRRRAKVEPYDPVDCSICFLPIGASRNYYYKCQHGEFCKLCLEKWRDKHNNCPICRAEPKKNIKNHCEKIVGHEEDIYYVFKLNYIREEAHSIIS